MSIMIFSYHNLETRKSPDRAVSLWLLTLLLATLVMILIGAATRLTDSGLSMVEWRPLIGSIPPLSEAEWQRIFALYQQIPEYQVASFAIGLAEFKQIFFWEYVHRLWGRLLGILFFAFLVYFTLMRRLNKQQATCLLVIPFLGAMQAVIGWWMVKSGLTVRVDVSQYRLAIHLFVALLIMIAIWEAYLRYHHHLRGKIRLKWNARLLFLGLIALTVFAGALVAGTRAGLIYNEFPLMGERLIPYDYLPQNQDGLNIRAILFENPASLQFHHRILAIITLVSVAIMAFRDFGNRTVQILLAIVTLQVLLGIATLLTALFLPLALLHQFTAVILLLTAWLYYRGSHQISVSN